MTITGYVYQTYLLVAYLAEKKETKDVKGVKMFKKVMLGIVALILLVGAENLLAKEKEEESKPKAKQQQKQVQKETKKRKSRAKRSGKKKAGKKTTPKRKKASPKKRRQRPAKEAAKKAKAEKARAAKARAAAARKRSEQVRDKAPQPRPGANRPAQQMFGKWLDELTEAYRENNREKMGQLIRKMHQIRQRMRQGPAATAGRGRVFQGRDIPMQNKGIGQGSPGLRRPWLRGPKPKRD